MESKNFMVTMDKAYADKLVAQGFELINVSNGCFTFINCPSKMSNEIKSKVIFTNKLCM